MDIIALLRISSLSKLAKKHSMLSENNGLNYFLNLS